MIRKFIPLDKLQIFDEMHRLDGNSFIVDQARDGQSTEEHKAGIEYMKSIIQNGQKVLPPLVLEDEYGEYIRLDGFKRCMAMKELGFKNIEAFVCNVEEYRKAEYIPFRNGKMRCWKGGQYDDDNNQKFPLLQESEQFNYENIDFLFKSPKHDGLRIELCEGIHVHWGEYGKNRLMLGRNDFIKLAEAIAKI